MTRIVRTEADLDGLELGEAFIIDVGADRFNDDPDGPIALLESPGYVEAQRLEKLVEERFTNPPPKAAAVAEPTVGPVQVSFTETHVAMFSEIDRTFPISGDVKDEDALTVKAGKSKERKLTNEGFGYVEVDGRKFTY